ncbi:MarR family transcriptional regulator [Rhodanobacter sp. C03]|uniref:MarR family winged helix-turn-helix transcriptional regulator n=1 Tax=Rhodanobacter sp. C03 TaxID=1945858 RepID=UPI0009854D39|nr:MarR family transcriptional regulator [Rhodanobacter sp. C03]OOG56357.1 MarR family transcriptional regulator [Rhodanobacter sp. C03]
MVKPKVDPAAVRTLAVAGELRVVLGKLKRRLREELHMGDLTWPQVSVLGHLERGGPATVTTLAQAEGVRPQSMGATVAALEKAGLVSGASDPNDGRQTVISLTAVCRDLIKASRAAREDWLFRSIRENLKPTEQKQLATTIELLKRIADS